MKHKKHDAEAHQRPPKHGRDPIAHASHHANNKMHDTPHVFQADDDYCDEYTGGDAHKGMHDNETCD